MRDSGQARVVVVGNEKGGSGKSTAAMHLVVAFLRENFTVASIDLDLSQRSLSRYVENRRQFIRNRGIALPLPTQWAFKASTLTELDAADAENTERLSRVMNHLRASHDVVVVDTPGNDTGLTRAAHACADTLITPLNDSFVDFDVLARIDPETMRITAPSRYAEMVWQQKKEKAAAGGGSVDWIVMRNRLSSLDARNKREMARLLGELSKRIGFRTVAGFGERVVYRELFLSGLTMMDLCQTLEDGEMTLSQVAARQEVRILLAAVLNQ